MALAFGDSELDGACHREHRTGGAFALLPPIQTQPFELGPKVNRFVGSGLAWIGWAIGAQRRLIGLRARDQETECDRKREGVWNSHRPE